MISNPKRFYIFSRILVNHQIELKHTKGVNGNKIGHYIQPPVLERKDTSHETPALKIVVNFVKVLYTELLFIVV